MPSKRSVTKLPKDRKRMLSKKTKDSSDPSKRKNVDRKKKKKLKMEPNLLSESTEPSVSRRDKTLMAFFSNLERITGLLIPLPLIRICDSYLGRIDVFDKAKKGSSLVLDAEQTTCRKICIMTSRSGANTVYGSLRVDINENPNAHLYRWTFVIRELRVNMVIGIDSNPIFMSSDFSNYFRNFGKRRDIFCGYDCDGYLYSSRWMESEEYGVALKQNDMIQMTVDTQKDELRFAVNGKCQGVAMDDLQFSKKQYSMAVSLFNAGEIIELKYFEMV